MAESTFHCIDSLIDHPEMTLFRGAFTNYVCIDRWVGGQKNANFITVKVQSRIHTW